MWLSEVWCKCEHMFLSLFSLLHIHSSCLPTINVHQVRENPRKSSNPRYSNKSKVSDFWPVIKMISLRLSAADLANILDDERFTMKRMCDLLQLSTRHPLNTQECEQSYTHHVHRLGCTRSLCHSVIDINRLIQRSVG